ncbi:hypothetical protein CR513_54416, partial [Mucuna pruriens]
MHVSKDERSKLDMKTRQCTFIGYGHDKYDYKMYDPLEKKLVKSRDKQFMEDQIIKDIDEVKKSTPEKDNCLFEIDLVWMPYGEQHNYVGDHQLGDGFDVPFDDDAEEEQEMSHDENLGDALEPPPIQLRRSNMQRQSSTRYTSDEYMEKNLNITKSPLRVKKRQKAWQSKLQKCVALSTTKAKLVRVQFILVRIQLFILDPSMLIDIIGYLTKVHNDDNGADIMTKRKTTCGFYVEEIFPH